MKVKLKKNVKLSQNRNYMGLDTNIWIALNQGKSVELNVIPKLIKDKIESVSGSKKKGDK
tara:strand:+ start:145 stop:324 length:180 start_codon:yes stop_codon:yes gene_type:complete